MPDIATWLLRRGAPVGAVGHGGMQFDRRSGRLVPLGEQEFSGPVTVDAIDVDDFMIVRVAAARAVGGFDEDLARGFDAVDYCLRLQHAGYGIYVDGVAAPSSRYDDVQSRIVLLRRYASTRRALAVERGPRHPRPAPQSSPPGAPPNVPDPDPDPDPPRTPQLLSGKVFPGNVFPANCCQEFRCWGTFSLPTVGREWRVVRSGGWR